MIIEIILSLISLKIHEKGKFYVDSENYVVKIIL